MPLLRYWLIRNRRTPFSVWTLLFFSIFVGITRGFLENLFFGVEVKGSDILGYIPFYFSLPFVYAITISLIPGVAYREVLQPVTFATLLGLLPPIIDFLLIGQNTHSVFYGYFLTHDYANFPWFGYSPERNYPIGEAITIWLTFLLVALFVYTKTKNLFYTLLGVIVGYAAFLIYSLVLPGITSYIFLGVIETPLSLAAQNPAKLRPLLFLLSIAQLFVAWFIDTLASRVSLDYARRILHFLPFALLTVCGLVISHAERFGIILSLVVIFSTGFAIVAQNDFRNVSMNQKQKRAALDLANCVAVMIYSMVFLSGYKLALLGIACFSLSVLYHYEFFNIRKSLWGSMKVEGLWAFFSFLIGVFAGSIVHPNLKIIGLAGIVFGGFSLFSILKDAKDLHEDFREGRNTLYTHFFRKKIPMRRTNLIVGLALGTLLVSVGIAYYSIETLAGMFHLTCSALALFCLLRIHKKISFQIFMATVCIILLNFSLTEAGFY